MRAANSENNKMVDVSSNLIVTAKEGVSGAPYGLRAEWSLNNTMTLFWNHPNCTNGDLKYFTIYINYGASSATLTYRVNQSSYQLTYSYKINKVVPPACDVTIKITPTNSLEGNPAILEDSSYPLVPALVNPNISVTQNTSTTLSIALNVARKIESRSDKPIYFLILISGSTSEIKDKNLEKLQEILNHTFDGTSHTRVTADIELKNNTSNILRYTIGETSTKKALKSGLLGEEIENVPLQEGQNYKITVLFVSRYKEKYSFMTYSTFFESQISREPQQKSEESSSGNAIFFILPLLLLLVLLSIIVLVMIFHKKIVVLKHSVSLENILDSTKHSSPAGKNNEPIVIGTKDSVRMVNRPVMKVKPKLSGRKSTNPPNSVVQIFSKEIKIGCFEAYVKASIENGELARQHALFPRGQTQPWKSASMAANRSKNRYNNLLAYDHSRVTLTEIPGIECSDYINANYIDGYNVEGAYIATQGPKPLTLDDFWRMIWEQNVRHIVMLANVYEGGRKKVEQYWPSINEELNFGKICVQYQSMELFADFEYRIFNVTQDDETRQIEQLHYTTWPDHGVPLYSQSLVPFLRKMLKIELSSLSPIVVHCSAGVGRTGTILLADICLRMAAKEGTVDMLNNLQKLREQRPNMVDNVEQYILAHLVVCCLVGLRTSIPCNDLDNAAASLVNGEEYRTQMDYLKETEWQDQAMKGSFDRTVEVVNYPEKNRIQDIIPENRDRVHLARYPNEDASSSYINAVHVDAFRDPGRFIVTQQPMPNTLGDFWRLVVENQTKVIISLNEILSNDKTCCKYWPTAEEPQLQPVDFILVTFGKVVTLEYYDIYSIRVHIKEKTKKEKMNIDIIAFKGWPAKSNLPKSCEEFLSFWEEADNISRSSRNIVVTCFNGALASGVYVALSFIIEKMKLEQECDVCLAVRTVRHSRKQFVTEPSQFVFLYEAAIKFINGFQSYANFQNQIV